MKRWVVFTEVRTIWHLRAALLGIVNPPSRSWRYYRFRWAASFAVWFDNHVPPLGIPAIVSSRLLGRVALRNAQH